MTQTARSRPADRPLKTIVVGYDETEPAERALARAAQLAHAFGARIVVADVAAPEPLQATPGAFGIMPYYSSTPERDLQTDEALWRQHRRETESFFAETGVAYEFAGVVGQPSVEIVEIAEERQADLIIVGTREPGFLERLLEGSVSQGGASRAHCDVLIVHPNDASDAFALAPTGTPIRSSSTEETTWARHSNTIGPPPGV